MKAIGGFLLLAGLAASGLWLAGKNLSWLVWIDQWGDNTGWAIRGGLVVLGGILWLLGGKKQPA